MTEATSDSVLIVDDEPLARASIRVVLESLRDVGTIHEAGSGGAATEAIEAHDPKVVFLDVRMPDYDGFEVLRRLPADRGPSVVFVTAFDDHAVSAFEEHAVDYVVKPFTDARLIEAWDRARRRARLDALQPLLEKWARGEREEGGSSEPRPDAVVDTTARRFVIHTRRRIYFVPMDSVDLIRASGNYVAVVAGGREHLIRTSMNHLEGVLDPSIFCRVHRSAIVNLDRVQEFRPEKSGDCLVVMADGSQVRMSRRYRDRLSRTLL